MTKVIIIDADGIVISKREKYFSERLSEEHNIPLDQIMPFFKNEFKQAVLGKADIKEALASYVTKWGWEGSVDDLLKYWFESENEIDEQVLKLLDRLRENGKAAIYLATDNEKRRIEFIKKEMGLESHFDGIFCSCDLGVEKSQPEFFEKVLRELGAPDPKEVQYWDDDEKNVEIAEKAGIEAKYYDNFEEFESEMTERFRGELSEGGEFSSKR